MGTRADFYIGKNKEAKWLGSIAWDGYADGIPSDIIEAKDEISYIAAVDEFLKSRSDATFPDNGWPWPWDSSDTTDCSYWFFEGETHEDSRGKYAPCRFQVWSCEFEEREDSDEIEDSFEFIQYPVFSKEKSAPAGSNRSGIMMFGG